MYENENATEKATVENTNNVDVKADIGRMLLPSSAILTAYKKP